MRYYADYESGVLVGIGTGKAGGVEITAEEYEHILSVIRSRPTPPKGYDYRLKEDLTWELYERPIVEVDDEISDEEALNIILGGDA